MNRLHIIMAWIVCGAVAICGLYTNNLEAVAMLTLPFIMYMTRVRQEDNLMEVDYKLAVKNGIDSLMEGFNNTANDILQ